MTQKEIRSLTKKRWIILIAACLINICIGSMYAWSALADPMARELGYAGAGDVSVVFSVANAVGFITMIIGGILNDKFGPRWVMFTGGVMFGLGMFFCGFAQNVTHLILAYGLLLGLGISMVYGCTISNTIKFFPDKRGMVGGMTTAFYGISSVIFAPLGNSMSNAMGPRMTFKVLGIIFLIVICAGSLIMKKCPAGFIPEGYVPPVNAAKASNDKTPLQMLKMPVFYVMLVMLTAGGTFGLMIISTAKPVATNMVEAAPATAALLVSVLCLFNTAGRLIAGSLSDKLGRINTLTVALVIALVGLGLLIGASETGMMALFVVGVILIGICFGTFMGVFPGFSTDMFGQKNNTVNYGIMWIGFSIAGIAGPTILNSIYKAQGSYTMAFVVAIAIAVLGLVMSFVYRALEKKSK